MYESSTKETKWVCIQLACSRRPRAFEEAHFWNIQAKFYNEKFPLVYESDKTVGERSNFKKIPTHTQDHGDA